MASLCVRWVRLGHSNATTEDFESCDYLGSPVSAQVPSLT